MGFVPRLSKSWLCCGSYCNFGLSAIAKNVVLWVCWSCLRSTFVLDFCACSNVGFGLSGAMVLDWSVFFSPSVLLWLLHLSLDPLVTPSKICG